MTCIRQVVQVQVVLQSKVVSLSLQQSEGEPLGMAAHLLGCSNYIWLCSCRKDSWQPAEQQRWSPSVRCSNTVTDRERVPVKYAFACRGGPTAV